MDDLVQWLGEQLDEDEQIARVADTELGNVFTRIATFDPEMAADERHIMAHRPTRVLREIDAKRDLLRFAQGIHDHYETFTTGVASRLEATLRLFALSYADRPGYREEWRP